MFTGVNTVCTYRQTKGVNPAKKSADGALVFPFTAMDPPAAAAWPRGSMRVATTKIKWPQGAINPRYCFLQASQWKDRKVVHHIATDHHGRIATTTVRRRQKGQAQRQVPTLTAIVKYNEKYGGVDRIVSRTTHSAGPPCGTI